MRGGRAAARARRLLLLLVLLLKLLELLDLLELKVQFGWRLALHARCRPLFMLVGMR